jgi:glutamine cyclotransferase
MIFFNNNYNIDDIKDPILYYKEQVSTMNSKLPNTMNYKVINIFQRKNPTVYTQGLFFYNYSIYESGGLYNKSSLVHMEWPSQKVIQKINLEEKYFAEGIAASNVNNILYQLTYQEKEILLYSFPQLKLKSKIKMPRELREGWGLCPGKEKDEFFATDGSDKIFVLKINKTNNELNVTSSIHVTRNMRPIHRLNELIYDGVFIYCNVYFERAILKINPHNGEVMNIYNMQPLIDYELENGKLTKNRLNGGDVLNGIVYIPEKKSYILTGKMWDYYYEIVFN